MRLENETNVLRLDPDRSTLIDAVFGNLHDRIIGVDHRSPVSALVDRRLDRSATVDDDIALRMLDEKPGHRDFKISIALIHFDVFDLRLQRSRLEHVQLDSG